MENTDRILERGQLNSDVGRASSRILQKCAVRIYEILFYSYVEMMDRLDDVSIIRGLLEGCPMCPSESSGPSRVLFREDSLVLVSARGSVRLKG